VAIVILVFFTIFPSYSAIIIDLVVGSLMMLTLDRSSGTEEIAPNYMQSSCLSALIKRVEMKEKATEKSPNKVYPHSARTRKGTKLEVGSTSIQ
jgi:hypothetical protein